jgi:hypothetical protein
MKRLEHVADSLSFKFHNHEEALNAARRRAEEISRTLQSAADSASTFTGYMSSGLGLSKWLPYVYCPLASLFVGSYGLPPSAARNFVLIGIGKPKIPRHSQLVDLNS